MKYEKNIVEYNNTKSVSGNVEYDMRDPVQRKAGLKALFAMIIPLVVFGSIGTYFIRTEITYAAVISIFLGVFISAYACITVIIRNKEVDNVGDCDSQDVYNFRVVRAVFVTIMLCATFIPFLSYIYSRICAKKFPECEMYQPGGMNIQIFTLIWSFISIFGIGLVILLWAVGAI